MSGAGAELLDVVGELGTEERGMLRHRGL